MTGKDVAAVWADLERLAASERPEMLRDLRGPASADDLARLRACGLPLPEALYTSLTRHDGEDDTSDGALFPHGGRWLPAAAMLDTRDMLREALSGMDDEGGSPSPTFGPVGPHTFNEQWLPIIDMNGDVVWYLDFDPAPGGQSGQVIRVDLEGGEWVVCAPDFCSFLAAWRDDLRDGRVFDTEGELREEQPWPPLQGLPALQTGVIGLAQLQALGEMGRWELALELADRVTPPLAPAQRLRLQARTAEYADDARAVLRALDAIAKLGEQTAEDILLRVDTLEGSGKSVDASTTLEAAIAASATPVPTLLVRRASLTRALAEQAPGKGRKSHKAQLQWLASPAGQQSTAGARERALADYDSALALDDRLDWRLERIELLLEGERWEEAEAACVDVLSRLDTLATEEPQLREDAERLLEQAQGRGEGESEEMLDSMDDMLAAFGELLQDGDSSAMAELRSVRNAFAGLVDAEASERQQLDAEPDSVRRRAREIADQLARQHADTPERFAPYDIGNLDKSARRWYDRERDTLLALGFAHCADVEPVRNTELSGRQVLMRVMLSQDRQVAAAVWRLAHPMGDYEVVELESTFADGSIAITNNTGSANPFEQPESISMLALPRGTPVRKLLDTHITRLAVGAAQPIVDLDAVLELQERQRMIKREAAKARGWVSDGELRGLLGASYRELAATVREELRVLL